jgi:hypothetical protein
MVKAKEVVPTMFARFRKAKGLCEFECGWQCTDFDCAVKLCMAPARLMEQGLFNCIELCKEHSSILVPRSHRRKSMFNLIGF